MSGEVRWLRPSALLTVQQSAFDGDYRLIHPALSTLFTPGFLLNDVQQTKSISSRVKCATGRWFIPGPYVSARQLS